MIKHDLTTYPSLFLKTSTRITNLLAHETFNITIRSLPEDPIATCARPPPQSKTTSRSIFSKPDGQYYILSSVILLPGFWRLRDKFDDWARRVSASPLATPTTSALEISDSPPRYPLPARDNLGGTGLYSTSREYTTILSALLSSGGPLLQRESVDEMFRPQLANNTVLNGIFNAPGAKRFRCLLTTGKVIDQGSGACVCVNVEDVVGGREKGMRCHGVGI
ncbi:hypothetical protein AJ80_07313 [Polytolypa hystricis UAMH7299]|uniref:Uncharacterized protein n=1 Tax=Polytolypa hystricis (strain UAMH7299) TaxID=1447883 RepID=A0A2B7XRA8_POLH7|nr:hypothetical protein AJ80_07313 [Polytolypa hystricis UAMH7299]